MILDPGVLALLLGSAVMVFFVGIGCLVAVQVLRHWDYDSHAARQLTLERRTWLVSVVMNYALGFGAASLFLFLFTVDDLHGLLVGAMCATGSLNANPIGWYALLVKVLLLFAGGGWIVLNRIDQSAEDYPLVRLKYGVLLLMAPLAAGDFCLQALYFAGIRPDVITSCCGSLFTAAGTTLASTVTAFPPLATLRAFYAGAAAYGAIGLGCLTRWNKPWRYAFGASSAALLPLSVAAVISVLSLYIYELPTHHCPFDILQGGYGFVGYPLYAALLGGCFFGAVAGALEPLRRFPSVSALLDRRQRRWVAWSLACTAAFVGLATYRVVFSNFRLTGYG